MYLYINVDVTKFPFTCVDYTLDSMHIMDEIEQVQPLSLSSYRPSQNCLRRKTIAIVLELSIYLIFFVKLFLVTMAHYRQDRNKQTYKEFSLLTL